MRYPVALERLIACFNRFQGVGRKTSERYVFELITRWDEHALLEFYEAILGLAKGVTVCPSCHAHVESLPCSFCSDERKERKTLCIVATSRDLYAIESIGLFPGTFYVLGSLLSPLDDRGVEKMEVELLKKRIYDEKIEEVIFALDSSLEGDATVSFLKGELLPLHVTVSRLASGVPVGASLDFVDRGTLSRAFHGRQKV